MCYNRSLGTSRFRNWKHSGPHWRRRRRSCQDQRSGQGPRFGCDEPSGREEDWSYRQWIAFVWLRADRRWPQNPGVHCSKGIRCVVTRLRCLSRCGRRHAHNAASVVRLPLRPLSGMQREGPAARIWPWFCCFLDARFQHLRLFLFSRKDGAKRNHQVFKKFSAFRWNSPTFLIQAGLNQNRRCPTFFFCTGLSIGPFVSDRWCVAVQWFHDKGSRNYRKLSPSTEQFSIRRVAKSCPTIAYLWLFRYSPSSLRTLWSTVIKPSNFSARGTASPVRSSARSPCHLGSQAYFAISVFWEVIRNTLCSLDTVLIWRANSEFWEVFPSAGTFCIFEIFCEVLSPIWVIAVDLSMLNFWHWMNDCVLRRARLTTGLRASSKSSKVMNVYWRLPHLFALLHWLQ